MEDVKSELAPPNILEDSGRDEESYNKQCYSNNNDKVINNNNVSRDNSDSFQNYHIQFSKVLCVVTVAIFTGVGIYSIIEYYKLMQLAIELQSSVTPDASLPITAITSILAAVLSYCLYHAALKSSLNKNNLMIDEHGVIKPILRDIVFKDNN